METIKKLQALKILEMIQETIVTELSSRGSNYQLTRDKKKRQIKPTKCLVMQT